MNGLGDLVIDTRALTKLCGDSIVAVDDLGSVARYLNIDAAPLSSLSSVEAFTEAAAQAAELGFTDLVVRWPRASVADHRQESVLEQAAAEVLPNLQRAPSRAEHVVHPG